MTQGATALHAAALKGSPEIIQVLLAGGATVDAVDNKVRFLTVYAQPLLLLPAGMCIHPPVLLRQLQMHGVLRLQHSQQPWLIVHL